MKTDKYNLIDILEERSLEHLVIPEIQRDYVWQEIDVLDLLSYINECYLSKTEKPYLGFIYAYNHVDFPYKYFLVDGQQRFTTLIILLLACYQKAGLEVPEYIFDGRNLKLDYKVRQDTHDFLFDLLSYYRSQPSTEIAIKDQLWYHNEYEGDRTIQNIITNHDVIKNWLDRQSHDIDKFIKFIEDDVSMSYFNIEESRQGEDLYIYMNSRGRQLEPNETLKARFLATTTNKEHWGTEWERWQDFFWKHKGDTRPDADAGFNDFLSLVQVLNMSKMNRSSDEISNFAAGRTDQRPVFASLPQTIEELAEIFEAYRWMVESETIVSFYKKQGEPNEYLTKMPPVDRRQAYYLRVLPVLAFLSASRSRDEQVVLRFVRFFYNVARKRQSVGKDIGNQLPSAVKLMFEYGSKKPEKPDVCDLLGYSKGRTILIDQEEKIKLGIYRQVEGWELRKEIEELFWKMEDHDFFEGEITFFLNRHYDIENKELDLTALKETWQAFQNLFIKKANQNKVALALLYFGFSWVRASPYYYENFNCTDWYEIVRIKNSSPLMDLLERISEGATLDDIIRSRICEYFRSNSLTTVEALKTESQFFDQIKILAAIDYFAEQKMFGSSYGHIAKDNRYDYKDPPFFNNKPDLFNVSRYISDGSEGRLMNILKNILQNNNKLIGILDSIIKGK